MQVESTSESGQEKTTILSRFKTKLSIEQKLVLLVYGMLLVIGLPGGAALLYTERADTTASYQRFSLLMVDTIREHVAVDMQTNDREHLSEDLDAIIGSGQTVKAIDILSNTAQVSFSSDDARIGKSANGELVARALESGKTQYGEYRGSPNQLAVVSPMPNGPGCSTCHGAQEKILGAIELHVNKEPLDAQLKRQTVIMALIGVSVLLAVGLAITIGTRRAIARPMLNTMAGMQKEQEKLIMQDRLASIGQLVSGVAHELNNPLTGVITFSQLLLQRDLPEDIKADLKIVNDEAQRSAQIVRNLLTFARKQPQAKLPTNINECIQRVLELRAYEQKVNNIEVVTRFGDDLPLAMGNPSQLQQVFFNIVINAEFFMLEAHGKGTLTISTEKAGNFVRASFVDDGPGISKANMARLFSPFFTTKAVGKGTGLGLSICQGITAEHGGRIYARSEFGKGATFVVELPAAATVQETR